MQQLVLKVRSVTYALKAKDILKNRGISSFIRKTPNPKKGEGCGYSVIVPNGKKDVISLLEFSGIEIIESAWEM